ncbi:MAG TPA: hypothetical protein DGB32_05265 [Dehalococcoidia bacterium]|nr:hypothetical protein [Dehalococcoidia bacterium]
MLAPPGSAITLVPGRNVNTVILDIVAILNLIQDPMIAGFEEFLTTGAPFPSCCALLKRLSLYGPILNRVQNRHDVDRTWRQPTGGAIHFVRLSTSLISNSSG